MRTIYLDAVGLAGPGLANWADSVSVLVDETRYASGETPRCKPEMLPANERRRVSPTVRLALKVAEEAIAQSSFDLDAVCSVFATCDGDTEIIDRICVALTQPQRPVSPTQFHNSVHNAAAGYWAIAAQSPMPYTTVSAYRASFAAGLMEASAQLQVEKNPVLLVAYDHTAPEGLIAAVGEYPPFAVAMILSPHPTAQSMRLHIETVSGQAIDGMNGAQLEALRARNPAASVLPLLRALAAGDNQRVILPHVNGLQLAINVEAK
jgi:hypothetical protein